MKLPYAEPLTPLTHVDRVDTEPPRRGETGGAPCAICAESGAPAVWISDLWTLHAPTHCSLPGTVWLASRDHVDSFRDLPAAAAADFAGMAGRVESAILERGGVARVHLYRWGDGGAHFHVWFIPRPHGMVDAQGMMLPLWEDVLPNVTDDELHEAARQIAEAIGPPASGALLDTSGDA